MINLVAVTPAEVFTIPFDAPMLAAAVQELNRAVRGGRINKIYQPTPHEIHLLVHTEGENQRLLISCHPQEARLHLTQSSKQNPPQPPTFCMLLRKHIEGGRIDSVRQPDRERVAEINIDGIDELGNPITNQLVAEVMGKHSNIILLGPSGRIIDAARRVGAAANKYREILPGVPYVSPPPTGKLDPRTVTASALERCRGEGRPLSWQWLLQHVDGMGPLMAQSIYRSAAEGNLAALAAGCRAMAEKWDRGEFESCLLYSADHADIPADYAAFTPAHWTGRIEYRQAPSQILDTYYDRKTAADAVRHLRTKLGGILRTHLNRLDRKEKAQAEELRAAAAAGTMRRLGELITANLWQIPNGLSEVELPAYDEQNMIAVTVAVTLNPALTPAENAQQYFRRYRKAKAALETTKIHLEQTRAEIASVAQMADTALAAASLPDLAEVEHWLLQRGYLKAQGAGHRLRAAAAPPAAPPLTLTSADGLEIWVGRNNRQNDYLTTRLAAPHDLWLHTKEIPGAHVILRLPGGGPPPERSLTEAAALAAYFSKARGSSQVPVDYTRRKHVRKPRGAKPGRVIYDQHRTIHITPDPAVHRILIGLPR